MLAGRGAVVPVEVGREGLGTLASRQSRVMGAHSIGRSRTPSSPLFRA